MALSVFGTPITKATLWKREEYTGRSEITTREIAVATLELKNEEGKDARAREFVEERRTKYAFDATMCLIYNATGDTIRLVSYCDAGDGFVAPSPYPMLIMNGQWGVYLKRGGGSVVYAVRNEDGSEFQVLFTYWSLDPGRCYTEIRQRDYYKPKDPWTTFVTPLNANTSYIYEAREYGIASFASIGGTTKSPVFEGIITLDGAWSRYGDYDHRGSYYPPPRPRHALVAVGAEAEEDASTDTQGPSSMATEQH